MLSQRIGFFAFVSLIAINRWSHVACASADAGPSP
ncbi:hypothetical protein [Roseibium sp.]